MISVDSIKMKYSGYAIVTLKLVSVADVVHPAHLYNFFVSCFFISAHAGRPGSIDPAERTQHSTHGNQLDLASVHPAALCIQVTALPVRPPTPFHSPINVLILGVVISYVHDGAVMPRPL